MSRSQQRPFSDPHPLADADTPEWQVRQGELAREKDRMRGSDFCKPMISHYNSDPQHGVFSSAMPMRKWGFLSAPSHNIVN